MIGLSANGATVTELHAGWPLLLDVVLLVAQCPGFFEIKRGRAGKVQLGPRP